MASEPEVVRFVVWHPEVYTLAYIGENQQEAWSKKLSCPLTWPDFAKMTAQSKEEGWQISEVRSHAR